MKNKNRIFKKALEAELVKLQLELKARQKRMSDIMPEHNYVGHYLDGQEVMLSNIMGFLQTSEIE